MESCIYEGRVRHTRTSPAMHRFSYRLFMMYLDLDELPQVFRKRWFWSERRPALARFKREHHLGPNDQPLGDAVRNLVMQETGSRPEGPIRLLTNMAYFGYCFNPVSFYYCFGKDRRSVEFIVAEVNNTPWGERDCYVMDCRKTGRATSWHFKPNKKMHVSPFMPMDVQYDWVLANPAKRLQVFMANSRTGKRFFDVSMKLQRTEISSTSLARVLLQFPLQTVKVIVAIYWEAMRLWIKRCPIYAHSAKDPGVVVRES